MHLTHALLVAALLSFAAAAPQGDDPRRATILEQSSNNIGVGPWSWSFRTSDGTYREESGQVINEGAENESIIVRGRASWIGADGKTYSIEYIADDNGFQPAQATPLPPAFGAPISNPALSSLLG